MTPDRIKQIEERLAKATPGEWLFGFWEIYDEDRAAQVRGEPYWTLCERGIEGKVLTPGPMGRKAMSPGSIINGEGHDCSGVYGTDEDESLIAHAPSDLRYLLSRVRAAEMVVEATKTPCGCVAGSAPHNNGYYASGTPFCHVHDALTAYDAAVERP